MSNFLSFNPAAALAAGSRVLLAAQAKLAELKEFEKKEEEEKAKAKAKHEEKEKEKVNQVDEGDATKDGDTIDIDESESSAEEEDDESGDADSSDDESINQPQSHISDHHTQQAAAVDSLPTPSSSSSVLHESTATATATAISAQSPVDASLSEPAVSSQSRKRKATDSIESETTINGEDYRHTATSSDDTTAATSQPSSSTEMDTSTSNSNDAPSSASAAAVPPLPVPSSDSASVDDDSTAPVSCIHYTSRGPSFARVISPLPSFDSFQPHARVWPFQLDEFQQRAITILEHGQHVLVAAHTSAGKTVVAEYAIAMVFRANERARQLAGGGSSLTLPPRQKRVIYTAPIKALSNQKYREFKVRAIE